MIRDSDLRNLMRSLLLILSLALCLSGDLDAQQSFDLEVRIRSGGVPIDAEGYRWARPFVGDFDGDGMNDLLVGQDDGGRLRIYHNQGTHRQPRFDGYEFLHADGKIAELPCHGEFSPQLVDFDGDGNLDILTNSRPGYIFWYQRNDDGSFNEAELLKLANGQPLIAGTYAACHAVDWDGDGDTDLILTRKRSPDVHGSAVAFVENTGSRKSPALSAPVPLLVDGEPIYLRQHHVYPFVVDWTGDGRLDLLVGLWTGNIMLYENRGEGATPELSPPRQLIPRRQADETENISRSAGGSFCVVDWDNDGALDILIGDQHRETIQPELTDEEDRLEHARQEATLVLRKYRQIRRLSRKIDESLQPEQKVFAQVRREEYAAQLKKLREEITALEEAMSLESVSRSYIWLLRRQTPQ